MAVSAVLLAGCEQLVPDEKTPQSIAESELLRKNGNALIESGRQQEAVIIFDKLIALDPQNALAYNGKAVAFDYSGNHLAAQDLYQTALSLSPNSLPIKNNLAMSLILNNQIKQAIKLLEPLVKSSKNKDSSNNIIRHNLALAYGISGQHEKATKLNLRDMTKEQAEENIRFYKSYAARNIDKSKDDAPLKDIKQNKKIIPQNEHNIGFITPSIPATPSAPITHKPLPEKTKKAVEPSKQETSPSFLDDLIDKNTTYNYPK